MIKEKALPMPEPAMILDSISGGLEVSAEVASDLATLEARLTDPGMQKRYTPLTPSKAATYLLRKLASLAKI